MIQDKIKNLSRKYFDKIVGYRRTIHQNPELSFQEKETADFIKSVLDEAGISYTSGWAGYGLVATIGNTKSNNRIALRADMDALPILENNTKPYKSKNDGIMHACGHDVHSSSLLGTALILKELEEEINGIVYFIFQPGEEKLPGGASIMIKEGLFEKEIPAYIFGQHVHPPLEVGKVGYHPGKYMASADEIYITVKGKGGHAAIPEKTIDPILMASSILLNLQQIVSRNSSPHSPSVLSFGKINSVGGATNVIPDEVKIEGTFRAMDEDWRFKAHDLIRQVALNTAKSYGGSVEVDILVGYPTLHNDDETTMRFKGYAEEFLGKENVVKLPKRMAAEDFAFYTQHVPACFYRLGTGNEAKGITSGVHTDTFDIDEEALKIGPGLMAWVAFNELEKLSS